MLQKESQTVENTESVVRIESNNEWRRPLTPNPKAEKKFENFKKAFEEHFVPSTQPVKHDRTAVLLLSWKEDDQDENLVPELRNDMDVSEELSKLTGVLKNEYNFDVDHQQLAANNNPQTELNSIIAQFVNRNTNIHNLCIFYYAGHGWSEGSLGQLFLTNNSSQNGRQEDFRKRNSVAWHTAERNIESTDADVFLIFDCCYGGALQTRSATSGRFETLTASGPDETTPGPGPTSFTSALIWALRELKDLGGFDSEQLKNKLSESPSFRKNHQQPKLFHHLRPNDDHVWIAPHTTSPRSTGKSTAQYREDRPMEFLDLRCRFSQRQNEDQVKLFAQALTSLARTEGNKIGLRKVELTAYASKFKDLALQLNDPSRRRRVSVSPLKLSEPEKDEVVAEKHHDLARENEAIDEKHQKLIRDYEALAEEREALAQKHEALVKEREALLQKSEALFHRRLSLTVKPFVRGIMLTLLLWFLFFYVPYYELLRLWRHWDESRYSYPWYLLPGRE